MVALQSEVDPKAALEMAEVLAMIRGSLPSRRAAVKFRMTEHFMAFVEAARKKKGGSPASLSLKNTGDEGARRAAKGGDAGGRHAST